MVNTDIVDMFRLFGPSVFSISKERAKRSETLARVG